MKKTVSEIVLLVLFLGNTFCFAQLKEDFIKNGDKFYNNWEYESALKEYNKAYKKDSLATEALWRIARVYIDIGNNKKKKIRESNLLKAVEFSEKIIEIDPDKTEGHFFKAAALGSLAEIKGFKSRIRISQEIKKEIDIVLRLNPDYGPAYYILGRLQKGIAGLNRIYRTLAKALLGDFENATNEDAVENFMKSLELDPDNIECRYQLSRTYRRLKQYNLAREQLEICKELPPKTERDVEIKKEAEEFYEKIKDKK